MVAFPTDFHWLCCAFSCRASQLSPRKKVSVTLVEPVEIGLAWMPTVVKRDNLSDFQRLQRKTKTGSKGDVSRFFRCLDMDKALEGRFAEQWNHSLRAMLPTRFSAPILVGTGGQGVVLSITDQETTMASVLKLVHFGNRKLVSLIRTCREIRIGKFCNHPNICQLYEVFSPEVEEELSYVIFLFEEVHTTLSEVLRECSQNPRPSHKTASGWLYQLLCAVHFLHERNIIHRDLKPSNIGLTLTKEPTNCQFRENFCNMVKLLDMGMARGLDGERPLTPELGTYSYMAPELLLENHVDFGTDSSETLDFDLLKHPKRINKVVTRPVGMYENATGFQDYDKSIDIWAVGVMFAEILLADGEKFFCSSGIVQARDMLKVIKRTVPICETKKYNEYVGIQNTTLLQEVQSKVRTKCSIDQRMRENLLPADDDLVENLNGKNARDLLKRMLAWNPDDRLTARQALEHPYFLHLISESELLHCAEKYVEKLPPTAYHADKMISILEPDTFKCWRDSLFAEMPWRRQALVVNHE